MNTFENPGQSIESEQSMGESFATDIKNFQELTQLYLRGEETIETLEAAEEALHQKLAKAIQDAKAKAKVGEFADMDPGRFERSPWDKLKEQ
jgi:predicted YcjX-like family ATPase